MPVGSTSPFRPTGTALIAAGTTSASVLLAGGGDSVVVTNSTSSLAYVRFGADPSVTATSGDMPILPNSRAMLSVNSLIFYAAVLLTAGSGTILLTRGDGSYL
jgi:hypothetical protein